MNNLVAIYFYDENENNENKIIEKNKNKIDKCIDYLKSTFGVNENKILYFIDTSTTDKMSLNNLLDNMRDGKIKNAVTYNVSSLSRDIDSILEIEKILGVTDSDIYIVNENQYLFKHLYISILNNKYIMEYQPSDYIDDEIDKEYEEIL